MGWAYLLSPLFDLGHCLLYYSISNVSSFHFWSTLASLSQRVCLPKLLHSMQIGATPKRSQKWLRNSGLNTVKWVLFHRISQSFNLLMCVWLTRRGRQYAAFTTLFVQIFLLIEEDFVGALFHRGILRQTFILFNFKCIQSFKMVCSASPSEPTIQI